MLFKRCPPNPDHVLLTNITVHNCSQDPWLVSAWTSNYERSMGFWYGAAIGPDRIWVSIGPTVTHASIIFCLINFRLLIGLPYESPDRHWLHVYTPILSNPAQHTIILLLFFKTCHRVTTILYNRPSMQPPQCIGQAVFYQLQLVAPTCRPAGVSRHHLVQIYTVSQTALLKQ